MPLDLPPGWAITHTLEHVPDPNEGTEPMATGPGFDRWTWICTDERGQYVCASGSGPDCESQALSMAQARTQQGPYDEASH